MDGILAGEGSGATLASSFVMISESTRSVLSFPGSVLSEASSFFFLKLRSYFPDGPEDPALINSFFFLMSFAFLSLIFGLNPSFTLPYQ